MGVSGGGLATSIVVFAVGAILRFTLTVNTLQHGFNIHTVGVILMIVGRWEPFCRSLEWRWRAREGVEPSTMTVEATSSTAKTPTAKENANGTHIGSVDCAAPFRYRVHGSLFVDRGRGAAGSVARRNGDWPRRVGREAPLLSMVIRS